jgi:hypothetical protein
MEEKMNNYLNYLNASSMSLEERQQSELYQQFQTSEKGTEARNFAHQKYVEWYNSRYAPMPQQSANNNDNNVNNNELQAKLFEKLEKQQQQIDLLLKNKNENTVD